MQTRWTVKEPGLSPGKDNRDDDKKRREKSGRQIGFGITYLITSLLVLWLFQVLLVAPLNPRTEIPYSEFMKNLADGRIAEVTIGQRDIIGEMKNPKPDGSPAVVPFDTVPAPAGDSKLIEELQNAKAIYRFERPPNPIGGFLLEYLMPLALLGGFLVPGLRTNGEQ